METNENLGKTFYESLGKLFYALAAADNIVANNEFECLTKMVKTQWVCHSKLKEKFSSASPLKILKSFDTCRLKKYNAEKCLEEFKTFRESYPDIFTADINRQIWSTAKIMAHCFPGINKSEVIMMSKIHGILEEQVS